MGNTSKGWPESGLNSLPGIGANMPPIFGFVGDLFVDFGVVFLWNVGVVLTPPLRAVPLKTICVTLLDAQIETGGLSLDERLRRTTSTDDFGERP